MHNNQIEACPEVDELLDFIKEECSLVCKMEQQLTAKEAATLLKEYPLNDLKMQLSRMDNYKHLTKKSRKVAATLRNWFARDIESGKYKPVNPNTKKPMDMGPVKSAIFEKFSPEDECEFQGKRYKLTDNGSLWSKDGRNAIPPRIVELYINQIKKV